MPLAHAPASGLAGDGGAEVFFSGTSAGSRRAAVDLPRAGDDGVDVSPVEGDPPAATREDHEPLGATPRPLAFASGPFCFLSAGGDLDLAPPSRVSSVFAAVGGGFGGARMASIGAVFLGPHEGLACSIAGGTGTGPTPPPSIEVLVPGGGGPGGSGGGSPGGSGGGSSFALTALLQAPCPGISSPSLDRAPPPPRPPRPSRLPLLCAAAGFSPSSDPSLTWLCLLCRADLLPGSFGGAPGGGGGGATPPLPPPAPQLPLLACPPRPPPSLLCRRLKATAPPPPFRPPYRCCDAPWAPRVSVPPIAPNDRM